MARGRYAASIPSSVVSSSALMIGKQGSSTDTVRAAVSQLSICTELIPSLVEGHEDTWIRLSVLIFSNFNLGQRVRSLSEAESV